MTHELRAGPFVVILQAEVVRDIRLHDAEVLSAIYPAVRDRNWGTIASQTSAAVLDVQPTAFSADLSGSSVDDGAGVHVDWQVSIRGTASGELAYSYVAIARRAFLRARVGLCVLHPLRLAGSSVIAEGPWGTTRGRFPDAVTAFKPFSNISSLRQEIGRATEVRIEFTGDLFQTEDQRAFGDPSFKTFSTPLELPWPVRVEAGTRIEQSVRVIAGRPGSRVRPRGVGASSARFRPVMNALPEIGAQLPPPEVSLEARVLEGARHLGLDTLRVVADSQTDGTNAIERAGHASRELGLALDVAIVAQAGAGEIEPLIAELEAAQVRVARLAVFDRHSHVTPPALAVELRNAARTRGLDIPIGGGSRAHFFEMALRGAAPGLDFVVFPLTPQVHASDPPSIMQTVRSVPALLESARRLTDNGHVHVAPLSTRALFDPYVVDDFGRPTYDVRQSSALVAAWTVGIMAELIANGAMSMTVHELAGWRGLLAARHEGLESMISQPGSRLLVGEAVASITSAARNRARIWTIQASESVRGFAVEAGSTSQIWLVSLTSQAEPISVPRMGTWLQVTRLEDDGRGWVAADPDRTTRGRLDVTVLPFTVTRIETRV